MVHFFASLLPSRSVFHYNLSSVPNVFCHARFIFACLSRVIPAFYFWLSQRRSKTSTTSIKRCMYMQDGLERMTSRVTNKLPGKMMMVQTKWRATITYPELRKLISNFLHNHDIIFRSLHAPNECQFIHTYGDRFLRTAAIRGRGDLRLGGHWQEVYSICNNLQIQRSLHVCSVLASSLDHQYARLKASYNCRS